MGSRQKKPQQKPYRIIGAYDSETTNITTDKSMKQAFPILHQIGLIDCDIQDITPGNVEGRTNLSMFRHTVDLYAYLDGIVAEVHDYIPVICCHNLGFDMYGLANFFSFYDCKVLAKSQRKPISFTINGEDGKPRLVIWDTLVFSQKSLGYMGNECGYEKLKGDWDYDLVRTPETPLTKEELGYAAHDIYSLLAWLGYWCRLNPDIDPSDLGYRVVSKTGVVRRRRYLRFGNVRGIGQGRTVGQWWSFINKQNICTTDDELYMTSACTRGGFTFCARESANVVFDFEPEDAIRVYGFDATSQHPSQIVSHRYPVRFEKSTPDTLTRAFRVIALHTLDDVLNHYEKPFGVAFCACFRFTNLRLKKGSIFERFGVVPLASARCKETYQVNEFIQEENQQGEEFRQHLSENGYRDTVVNPTYAFGKLEAADSATLYMTELTAWEVAQAYDYDSVVALDGYISLSFDKPSDMCVISVMQFYAAKNEFKHAQEWYFDNEPADDIEELKAYGIPEFVIEGMESHTIDDSIVKSTYLGLKADLNALFGIEACNEYRRDTVLGKDGITYTGDFGIVNAPKKPKAWYQCGQRIVGWSRIAQIVVMLLCEPYIETIVNGDTDSVKFVIRDENVPKVKNALERMNQAIDIAKKDVCSRVERMYPSLYSSLDGIGYYVLEFDTLQFCAAWNKAYCIRDIDKRDGKSHVKFTLAGVPCSHKDTKDKNKPSINELADQLIDKGWSFGDVCDRFLGYNTTYSPDITGLNARSFPEWGEVLRLDVTDYLGETVKVTEPAALCLYPMAKTVNDTATAENRNNLIYARKNRPSVCEEPCIVSTEGITYIKEMIDGE